MNIEELEKKFNIYDDNGRIIVCNLIKAIQQGGTETDWEKSIKEYLTQNGNTTEIGGNAEVDGNLQVNSKLEVGESGTLGTNITALIKAIGNKLVALTLTEAGGIYTSSQTFTKRVHLNLEIDTNATHSTLGIDLNPYDTVESLSVGRITIGGQFYDVICKLDSTNHIVIDLSQVSGITNVVGKTLTYN